MSKVSIDNRHNHNRRIALMAALKPLKLRHNTRHRSILPLRTTTLSEEQLFSCVTYYLTSGKQFLFHDFHAKKYFSLSDAHLVTSRFARGKVENFISRAVYFSSD